MDNALPSNQAAHFAVRWQWLIPVGVFVLALLVFSNTFSHGMMYSWDDNRYLRENHLIRDFSIGGIANIFTQFYFAAYIPVTLFSYWVEYNIWGLEPGGYHVVNVVIHALNGALVCLLIERLIERRWIALFAAVLFVVHPTQVESVAWISERKNVLAMLFMLLAFLAHIRSAQPGSDRRWSVLTWVLFWLAVFSKPTVVGVPLLFGVYDILWAKMPLGRAIIRNAIPLVIAATGALLIIVAHDVSGGIKDHRGGSPLGTAAVMMVVLWDYVVALVAPINLNNFYRYPFAVVEQNPVSVALGILILVSSVWFAIKQPLGRPFSLFAVLWIWLFMLPVSNIIPIAIERADRYMYFPSVAIFALVGLALERMWSRLSRTTARAALLVAVAAVIAAYTFLTVHRNLVWTDEGTLWTDHLQDYPTSETGWLNLGVFHYNEADFAGAVPAFTRLLDIAPNHFKANRFMAHINLRQERYAEAIPYYQRAIAVAPADEKAITLNYLGLAHFRRNDFANAVVAYREAVALDSTLDDAYTNLGVAALNTGDNALAQQALAVATERHPTNALLQQQYCSALANLDRFAEAVEACRQSATLEPDNGFYAGLLAHVLLQVNRVEEALAAAQRAVATAPDATLSHRVLGDALRLLGRNEEALVAYQRSLELDPENFRSREALTALSGG